MDLTLEQKQELADCISKITHHRETYYEVYDHVLSALSEKTQPYNVDLVNQILKDDFGGIIAIEKQEGIYKQEISSKYFRLFRNEMLNTFKWPGILGNLANLGLCLTMYFGSLDKGFNYKPIMYGMAICTVVVYLFFPFKKFVLDRREKKPSLKYGFLWRATLIGIVFYNFLFFTFLSEDGLLEIDAHTKEIIILIFFFFTSIYVRSFIKLYNEKIKILTT